MERKDYKLEIINELFGTKFHVRALAKKMGTNHTTLLRKLNELYKENVVDYDREGKNKVYFLKKTSEAKTYVFMSENYNLKKAIGKYPYLRNLIEKIQKNPAIKMAVLFGSHAKFFAGKESDIDIYIENLNSKIRQELEKADSRINIKTGKYDKKNPLIREIEKNHVIIKGVENFYERDSFFE